VTAIVGGGAAAAITLTSDDKNLAPVQRKERLAHFLLRAGERPGRIKGSLEVHETSICIEGNFPYVLRADLIDERERPVLELLGPQYRGSPAPASICTDELPGGLSELVARRPGDFKVLFDVDNGAYYSPALTSRLLDDSEPRCAGREGSLRLLPTRAKPGTRVQMRGACFPQSYRGRTIREVFLGATVHEDGRPYWPNEAPQKNELVCDLLAGDGGIARLDEEGSLRGYFIVPEEGTCSQDPEAGTIPVGRGLYDLRIGCTACSFARFRVIDPDPTRNDPCPEGIVGKGSEIREFLPPKPYFEAFNWWLSPVPDGVNTCIIVSAGQQQSHVSDTDGTVRYRSNGALFIQGYHQRPRKIESLLSPLARPIRIVDAEGHGYNATLILQSIEDCSLVGLRVDDLEFVPVETYAEYPCPADN
jgi:hypothetical protein